MFRFDKAFRQEFQSNWLPLAIAFSCLLFGLSASGFAMPFLFPEVISEFGWSREQATLLASTKYICAAFGAVFFGLLIGKLGMWFILFLSMVLSGLGLVGMIWISSLPMYYLSGAVIGVAVGGGGIALKVLIARSFHASQGTAMGIALMGSAIGATTVPIIISFLISTLGWRYGFAALSLAIWFIVIPLLVCGYFYSQRQLVAAQTTPGDHDASPTAVSTGDQEAPVERVLDIMRQKNFWLIGTAVMITSIVDAGFTQHQVLILKDFGLLPATVVSVISLMGLISIGSRILVGNILDSTSNKGLAGLYMALLLACAAAPFLSVPIILVAFVLFRAVGKALVLLDATVMMKHSYGNTRNLGTLFGFMTAIEGLGWAAGPLLMGRIFDVSGSYNLGYAIFAGLSLVAVLLALKIKPEYWLTLNQKREELQASVSTPSIANNPRQG